MTKRKTIEVKSWDELIKFVSNTNYYTETIVLTGWTRFFWNGKEYIRTLFFSTAPVELLREIKNGENGSRKKSKSKKTTENSSDKNS